jgi:adenylate cyclase
VHYAGDGLMALWNAPKDLTDHAARACRAALAILGDLPELDVTWRERLGGPLSLGIGLNTGLALCGNTGTKQKFHYGALGHAVNVASRVEGATKQFGIPLLITGSTRAQLGDDFAARRLCRARLVGIDGVVDLHELHAESASEEWSSRRAIYEKGLALYEAGAWVEACGTLHPLLLGQSEYDRPTLTLLARATQALREPPERFEPVIDLDCK